MNIYSISTIKRMIDFDIYLNKKIYKVGYSFKYKNPTFLWYRLNGSRVNKLNIKRRLTFYKDLNIPKEYRSLPYDYNNSGYDKGHLASDSSFDYSNVSLDNVYSMVNIIPMKANLNRKGWYIAERYSRYLAVKLKYVYVANIIIYGNDTINNNGHIPIVIYKVILNNKFKMLSIFKFNQDDNSTSIKNNIISFAKLKQELTNT